jgi:hypothetical protein
MVKVPTGVVAMLTSAACACNANLRSPVHENQRSQSRHCASYAAVSLPVRVYRSICLWLVHSSPHDSMPVDGKRAFKLAGQ